MKKIALTLFAFLSYLVTISQNPYAPRVPNTNNFSLQDVVDVVKWYAATTNPITSLADCYLYALPAFFNPSYNNDTYAEPSSLARFRDYGGHSYQIYGGNSTNYTWAWSNPDSYGIVEMIGAGGGGGGRYAGTGPLGCSGGGAGGYVKYRVLFKQGVSYSVNGGLGGSGHTSGTVQTDGENARFSIDVFNFIFANGGKKGEDYVDGVGATGGAGGISGGQIGSSTDLLQFPTAGAYNGGGGGNVAVNRVIGTGGGEAAYQADGANCNNNELGGNGNTQYVAGNGGMGCSRLDSQPCSGDNGFDYGGGGGGGRGSGNGGNGAQGVVVIWYN